MAANNLRVKINGQSYVVKSALVAAGTTENRDLVAAVTGRRIRLLSLVANGNGAASFRLESGAAGTALTPVFAVSLASALGTMVLPFNEQGYVETAAGAALSVEHTGAGTMAYLANYIEI